MFRTEEMFLKFFYLFAVLSAVTKGCDSFWIEDFSSGIGNATEWLEHSDTIQTEGKSKAVFAIQKTAQFRRAILFTLLNPQPCGAAFAGIKQLKNLDLTDYNHISLRIRGQGQFKGYQIFLKQSTDKYSYCTFFEAPDNFSVIDIPINDFQPYHEGEKVNNPKAVLQRNQIKTMGILAYGGRFLPKKQSGTASLEIDWIKLE